MADQRDLQLDVDVVKALYGVLLRDGVVIWPEASHDSDHSDRWKRFVLGWFDAICALAVLDGLFVELSYYRLDDLFLRPAVCLLRPDKTRIDTHGNHWWPDQEYAAARRRPIAERAWGRVLEEARARFAGERHSTCPDCNGSGYAVIAADWDDGAYDFSYRDEPCPRCKAAGIFPSSSVRRGNSGRRTTRAAGSAPART